MIAGFFYLWGLVVVVNLYGVGWVWLLGLVGWVGSDLFFCLGWGYRVSIIWLLGCSGLMFWLDALACSSGVTLWLVPLA